MKLLKISSLSLFVLLVFVFAAPSFAAGTPSTSNTTVVKTLSSTSNVKVQNAKIVSQKGPIFNISFDLVNLNKAQSGIKYSVKLINATKSGQYIADEYIYPETLSLSPNSTVKKDIVYTAPSGISGSYTAIITVTNSNGTPIGLGIAGTIENISTPASVEVLLNTCSLSVLGEKGDIKYSLSQGVDIATSEKLILNCSVINHSKKAVSVTPLYETHFRTLTGDIVAQEGGDTNKIEIDAEKSKSISLALPKVAKPQAYDIKVSLIADNISSNPVVAHYVLRGESATIENLLMDKDYYKNKDTANISLSWSPSADGFVGNRSGSVSLYNINLGIKIVDDNQLECISPINKILNKTGLVEIAAPIIKDCNNPIATVEIADANGNILDQKILSFESKTPIANSGIKTIILIFGVLIIIGLAVYFINLKKKGYAGSNLSQSNETNI